MSHIDLTVDGLLDAILSARDLEKLQGEVRDAMIDTLTQQSTDSPVGGVPNGPALFP